MSTMRDRARAFCDASHPLMDRTAIIAAFAASEVAREREECAKIAERFECATSTDGEFIARRIRARNEHASSDPFAAPASDTPDRSASQSHDDKREGGSGSRTEPDPPALVTWKGRTVFTDDQTEAVRFLARDEAVRMRPLTEARVREIVREEIARDSLADFLGTRTVGPVDVEALASLLADRNGHSWLSCHEKTRTVYRNDARAVIAHLGLEAKP